MMRNADFSGNQNRIMLGIKLNSQRFPNNVVFWRHIVEVLYGKLADIDLWMKLVEKVSWNFPGLETMEEIESHKQTVIKFINDNRALCVKVNDIIVGVLLFSKRYNMICCLAVDPEYRRQGIASALLEKALDELDRRQDITVSTFRENDVKGTAPRKLYKKYGFIEDELIEEFGYPNQKFVLHPQGIVRK